MFKFVYALFVACVLAIVLFVSLASATPPRRGPLPSARARAARAERVLRDVERELALQRALRNVRGFPRHGFPQRGR